MLIDVFVHRVLRMPYTLNVRYSQSVKNARATLLFLHGIGDTGEMWQSLLQGLPKDVSYLVVDLLGFGDSPRPAWHNYSATDQARCLFRTYRKANVNGPLIIVGHSLGGLVAIEFAKRYSSLTKELILCSPPIYDQPSAPKERRKQEDFLRSIYQRASKDPAFIIKAYSIAQKIRITHPSIVVEDDNIEMFIKALYASIINQDTINDIKNIKQQVTIINGLLDPLVVRRNLVNLQKTNSHIQLIDIPTSHAVNARYQKTILRTIAKSLSDKE